CPMCFPDDALMTDPQVLALADQRSFEGLTSGRRNSRPWLRPKVRVSPEKLELLTERPLSDPPRSGPNGSLCQALAGRRIRLRLDPDPRVPGRAVSRASAVSTR